MIELVSSNSNFDNPLQDLKDGTYPAVCIAVADIGVQDTPYGPKRKLAVVFELEDESGKHITAYQEFTNSAKANSAFAKAVSTWLSRPLGANGLAGTTPDGKPLFTVESLLGRQANLVMTHQGKTKLYKSAVIFQILPKGDKIVKPEVEPFSYELSMGQSGNYEKLPYFVRKSIDNNFGAEPKIKAATAALTGTTNGSNDLEPIDMSDIPF